MQGKKESAKVQIGDRVIAVASKKDNKVFSFGSGIYMGELVPEFEGERGSMADMLKQLKRPNPTIKLDIGDLIYGCECWWGSETKMLEQFASCEVEIITVQQYLNKGKESTKNEHV
jgi:hypothetical protein